MTTPTRRIAGPLRLRSILTGAFALAAVVLAGPPSEAVVSQTWRVRERADFEKGEPKGVSLAPDGTLRLSPKLDTLFEARQPYVWALAQDSGGNLFASSGNDGAIYRITPSGKGEVFFRAAEPEVHALAVDGGGNVYAGTAPGGRIYKIAPDGRQAWTQPSGESYVWALVLDAQGNLFAGTGVEGRVIKIDASGHKQVFFDSAETHIRTLIPDDAGNLLAGSDGHGLIFRISPRGEGTVLYDAPLNEVAALAIAPQGTIYAAVVGESGRAPQRAEKPSPQPSPSPTPPSSGEGGGAPSQPSAGPSVEGQAATDQKFPINMEGKLLMISPDGYGREIWSGTQEAVLSLAFSGPGRLLLGSSAQGKLYALEGDDTVAEIARTSSSQVTALLRRAGAKGAAAQAPGDVAVAGSNFGTVSLLRTGFAPTGSFESRVFDARSFATWGRVSWRADTPKGTSIALSARSGNTEEPDRTWSEWGPALPDPEGSLLERPPARFLQWRAQLKTEDASRSPVLREVTVTYLQRNLPPEIRKVEVLSPGVSFQKIPATQPGASPEGKGGASTDGTSVFKKGRPQSRRGFDPGARSVTWQASDPNDDDLVFDVYYRAIDETTWKPIRTRIDEDFVTLDSTAMPDGSYVFRIVASDAASNPSGQALTSEKLSEHFDVDNTPPRVEGMKAQPQGSSLRLTFSVTDTFSIVREASYAVDAGDWVACRPVDGVSDSLKESYDLVVPSLPPGEHSIVVRAADAAGNSGAGKLIVKVP